MTMALATAARFECAERLRLYPDPIQRDRIKRDAATIDTEVWDRIATALEQATPWTAMLSRIDYPVIWSEVVTAIDQATRTRANACKAKPDDLPLTRRRDAIAAIVALMFIDVMAELRAPPPLKDAA